MSIFIGGVTNNQCRSHHQKKIACVRSVEDYIHLFYQAYYKERLLGVEQLKK
jgi:hypothetical protein